MQKRSHKLLAKTLLAQHGGFGSQYRDLAFLFGSFQPDCNPLSYLKGSLRGRRFHGHDFSNSRRFIYCRIHRLQRRKCWHIWQYYTLGKLTHYLADAFTYAHSQQFPSHPHLHHQYESQLRHHLTAYLANYAIRQNTQCRNIPCTLDRLHRKYLLSSATPLTDVQYILQAAELLMTLCPSSRREAA